MLQPPSIVLPGTSPSTSWLALFGLGFFKDHRRWRRQERLDPYLLASHLIGNHLQANGARSLPRECSQNQQRKQCPSHVSLNKCCSLLTNYTGSSVQQMHDAPQRHRSLGNHAEVRWVKEMPSQVVNDAPSCGLNISRVSICAYRFVMTSENLLVLFVSFSFGCLVLSIYEINRPAEG